MLQQGLGLGWSDLGSDRGSLYRDRVLSVLSRQDVVKAGGPCVATHKLWLDRMRTSVHDKLLTVFCRDRDRSALCRDRDSVSRQGLRRRRWRCIATERLGRAIECAIALMTRATVHRARASVHTACAQLCT